MGERSSKTRNDEKTQLAHGMRDTGESGRERGSEIRGERRSQRMSRRQDLLSGVTHDGCEEINGWEAIEIGNDG